jgi:Fe2+ or Zn2+ uptake regulation protein
LNLNFCLPLEKTKKAGSQIQLGDGILQRLADCQTRRRSSTVCATMPDSSHTPSEQECNVSDAEFVEAFERIAVEHLRGAALRITATRLAVIRALASSRRALSAQEIHRSIGASGGRIDAVSVYRILAALQSVGLVHHVGLIDGYFACREHQGTWHAAGHLVCGQCGCVTEVSLGEEDAVGLRRHAVGEGFAPSEIRVEMLGICEHCRQS